MREKRKVVTELLEIKWIWLKLIEIKYSINKITYSEGVISISKQFKT